MKLCSRGYQAARRKFKVYPSAYANAYASKVCSGKVKGLDGKRKRDWSPRRTTKRKPVRRSNRRKSGRRSNKRTSGRRRSNKRKSGRRRLSGGKWSQRYKKSINCRNPKGFSQKQYCKYVRKKKSTKKRK